MRISDNNGASSSPLDMEPVQTLVVSCLTQPAACDMADFRGMRACTCLSVMLGLWQ